MPNYDVKQVSEIATTILGYEKDRHARGSHGQQTLAKVHALTTSESSPSLGWWGNVEHGALPLTRDPRPDTEHPLEFVVVFEDDEEVAEAFHAKLNTTLEDENNEVDTGWRTIKACPIPPPKNPDLRFKRSLRNYFHPHHAAWYLPRALKRVATDELTYGQEVGHFLGLCSDALTRAGQSIDILRDVAARCVKEELDKKAKPNTNYTALSEAIALANQQEVQDQLMQRQGVMQCLLITLRQSSPAAMITGLRAVATNARFDMTSRFGRAPTIDELLAANVKNAAHMWEAMPWSIMQPLVQRHGDQLRAALLKRTDFPYERYKNVFTDSEKRSEVRSSTTIALEGMRAKLLEKPLFHPASRLDVLRQRGAYYRPAVKLREALLADYPLEVAQLIVLRHLDNRAALGAYIEPILTDRVRRALTAYGNPGNSG